MDRGAVERQASRQVRPLPIWTRRSYQGLFAQYTVFAYAACIHIYIYIYVCVCMRWLMRIVTIVGLGHLAEVDLILCSLFSRAIQRAKRRSKDKKYKNYWRTSRTTHSHPKKPYNNQVWFPMILATVGFNKHCRASPTNWPVFGQTPILLAFFVIVHCFF